jgi:ATP-dependent Lhr-like helicase
MKQIAAGRGEEEHFQVHHGSIAAALREETEKNLRETEGAQTIAATATLELGIDIGKLDRIIQIGAPMTVSAFVQRLGRSGRRSGVSQMYFCSREAPQSISASPLDRIPWVLIKTIAIIELYLEEQWTEDAEPKPLPYSLLCHQTLSVLASLGEQTEEALFRCVLSLPPFRGVESTDYAELLRYLEKGNYLERTEEGKFIIGLAGECIVNYYSFYSVFPDEQEFRVTCAGKELGKVNFIPPEGSGIVLGGQTWKVESVRLRSKEICVIPGSESGVRIWRGGSGSLHTKVVRRMKQVLLENRHYPYLTVPAAARLREGREWAEKIELGRRVVIIREEIDTLGTLPQADEPSGYFMFPWFGSRGMRSLSLVLQKKENRERLGITAVEQENPFAFRLRSKLPVERFSEHFNSELKRVITDLQNPEELVDERRIPFTDKYDYLLPPRLLIKQFAANMLDIMELKKLEL